MSNYIYGPLNVKNNLIGINYPSEPNKDLGLVMQIDTANIVDVEAIGLLVSATATTAEIHETVDIGWVIEVNGEKKRILAVSGFVVTVPAWTVIPSPGDGYKLYKNTNFAIVFRPQTKQLLMGYTYNDSVSEVVNVQSTVYSNTLIWADNIYVNKPFYVACANLAWNTSVMSATVGKLVLYVETTATVTVQLLGDSDLGTVTYNATGHYVQPVNFPLINTLLKLQVSGYGYLRSVLINW